MALKNRSRVEILYDIVSSARTAAKKTHLMYKSNLSFKQLDMYLQYILQSGLLKETIDEDGNRLYALTSRGVEFLGLFEHLKTFFPTATATTRPREEQEEEAVRRGYRSTAADSGSSGKPIPIVKPTFAY